MSCATSVSMLSSFKMLRTPSPSQVIEHGLIVGILLVLVNATIRLETLDIMAGVVGVLAVCVMKESACKHRNCGGDLVRKKSRKVDGDAAPCLFKAEPTTQTSIADDIPPRDAELVQLRARVQAEVKVLRAEYELEIWKYKAEAAEAELFRLRDKASGLERDLSQAQSDQLWTAEDTPRTQIEALLMELTETKLKVEEVDAELAQAQVHIADLENDLAQATSIQRDAEDIALARLEASSTNLTNANDEMATGFANVMWNVDHTSAPCLR